jgi:excinuclease ABC subunit A
VAGLGIDVDKPWRRLRKKDRDWLLYTDEQPSVLIKPERDRVDYGYYGKFWSARKHVMHVLADSKSQRMRDRAMRFVRSVPCPECDGSGLRPEALAVTFAGSSIAEVNAMALTDVVTRLRPVADLSAPGAATSSARSGEATEVAVRICADLVARVEVLLDLGLGYLSLGRRSTTLSPGEAQRMRIATQLRSGLFGVVYVLDEPSAGLHPADAEPLLEVLDRLLASGNSLFVVEHDMDVVRRADWVVDIGPGAGEGGGRVLYSGPVAGLEDVEESATSRYLFGRAQPLEHRPRAPQGWLHLRGVTRHNLQDVSVDVPLCVLTAVTGVSGSGKSTLVTQVLAEVVGRHLRPGSRRSTGSCWSTSGRSGARPGPTWRRTPGCSTRSAGFTRRRPRHRHATTPPDGSPSTSRRVGARRARARASWRSSCCSCPAPTLRARPATERATTPTRSR